MRNRRRFAKKGKFSLENLHGRIEMCRFWF